MSELMEAIQHSLTEEQVSRMATRIGADPQQTMQAISMALPAMLGSLARNSSQTEGSHQLHALVETAPNSNALDSLTSWMPKQSPGSPNTHGEDGHALGFSPADVLGQILGGRQSRVEQGVSKTSGLSGRQTTQLLLMLAPLILSFLKKRQQQTPMSPGDLSSWLGQQNAQVEKTAQGSLLGRFLDQDGDGDFDLADIMKFGMSRLFGGKASK